MQLSGPAHGAELGDWRGVHRGVGERRLRYRTPLALAQPFILSVPAFTAQDFSRVRPQRHRGWRAFWGPEGEGGLSSLRGSGFGWESDFWFLI
jgi:hypothetical protein